MKLNRSNKKDSENWVISEVNSGPMGESKEVMVYSGDLKPLSRNIDQMGQKIIMNYAPGIVSVNAMNKEIEITYTGAFMSDGSGFDQLVSGLPLAEGYQLSFNMADMSTMKSKQVNMVVEGRENFNDKDCWKVSLTSVENENDKSTFWINTNDYCAEKTVSVIPAMGNATITSIRQ